MHNPLIPHSRPTIRKDELKNTLECMVSDSIAPGQLAKNFENQLSKYLNMPYIQSVSSGSIAFFLILKILNVQENDEIILSSYSPSSLLNPIFYLKAKPILVDCNPNDYSPVHEQIGSKITEKTKAILLSHLFGMPIHVSSYSDFKIPLIEHSSHGLGGDFEGKKCGSMADYSFFSFYATQIISTGGSGGAVCLKKKEDLDKLSLLLRNEQKDHFTVTYPFLMNDLQAAMGLSQLSHLEDFISYRHKIADFYTEKLKEAGKITPSLFLDRKPVYYQYIVKSTIEIEDSLALFKKYNIEAKLPINGPLHHYLKLDSKDFPNSEKLFRENISVPIYPTLKKAEAETVAKIITKI